MPLLNVSIDARAMEQWADELSQRGLKNAARRAVDQSATAARKVALKAIADDIGVPTSRLRNVVTKVQRTTQNSLSASFTAKKSAINILATGAKVARLGGLTASTYRLTGGPSSALHAKNAFLVTKNGASFVVVRRGKARLPVKPIFAENAAYGLSEGVANKVWTKAAQTELSLRLAREVQRQLITETLSASTPADSGD